MKISLIATGLVAVALPLTNASDAYNAYIYYSNAECSDSTTISGTFTMAYDNSLFEGMGLEYDDYEGECLYFNNGYIDLLNDDVYSSFMDGYCVECNGIVGCSSTQSCEELMTGKPQNVQLYQMSMGEASEVSEGASNKYQMATPTESDIQAMEDAETLALMRLEYGSIKTSPPMMMYAVVCALMTLVAITALVAAFQRWRRKSVKAQSDAGTSFVEFGAVHA